MSNLYYSIIAMITDMITGYDHTNLKIWELFRWVTVEQHVTTGVNIGIASIVGITIIIAARFIFKRVTTN